MAASDRAEVTISIDLEEYRVLQDLLLKNMVDYPESSPFHNAAKRLREAVDAQVSSSGVDWST